MGDFDRVESGTKKTDQSKKIVLGVLGVVLAGVVIHEMTKSGSQSVAAAEVKGSGSADSAAPSATPEQVLRSLKVDPTANLLLGGGEEAMKPFAKTPRNPFRMVEKWRRALAPAAAPMTVQGHTPELVVPKPEIPRLVPGDYKFVGTFNQNGTLKAFVNNQMVSVGDVVGLARVVSIREGSVKLEPAALPGGPTLELQAGGKSN